MEQNTCCVDNGRVGWAKHRVEPGESILLEAFAGFEDGVLVQGSRGDPPTQVVQRCGARRGHHLVTRASSRRCEPGPRQQPVDRRDVPVQKAHAA